MLIDVQQLSLHIHDVHVIDDFSLKLAPESRVGLTGPSGCGKSTILKGIVNGYFGHQSTSQYALLPEQKPDFKIAYCPQNDGLLPWFSLSRNIKLFSDNDCIYSDYVLEHFGLITVRSSFPVELSGGEYQRSVLACSIVQKPGIYIVDEPLTEVDLALKWKLLEFWSQEIISQGASVVVVSHDIETLCLLCDEILFMSDKPSQIVSRVSLNGLPHPRKNSEDIDSLISETRAKLLAL